MPLSFSARFYPCGLEHMACPSKVRKGVIPLHIFLSSAQTRSPSSCHRDISSCQPADAQEIRVARCSCADREGSLSRNLSVLFRPTLSQLWMLILLCVLRVLGLHAGGRERCLSIASGEHIFQLPSSLLLSLN